MSRARRSPLAGVLAIALVLYLTGTALAAPANPRFAISTAPISHEVLINWEPVAPTGASTDDDVAYRIYQATSSGGSYSLLGTAQGRWNVSYISTCTPSGDPLLYLTRYWYKIASGDLTGWNSYPGVYMTGTPSGVTAETLMSPTTGLPEAPRGLEATYTADGSTIESITLTWDPVDGTNIARYAVYRATYSGNGDTLIGTTTETETPTYEDTYDLTVETHYWYRVAAVATDGSTDETGALSFELHVRPMSNEELDVPHSNPSADGTSCGECHDAHCAAGEPILCMETGTEQEFCLACHDGTGSKYDILADYEYPTAQSRHPVDAGDHEDGDLTCTDCHTPHGDPDMAGSYKLLASYGETGTAEYCLSCHDPDTEDDSTYTTRTIDMTAFRDSDHNAEGVADPESGTEIKCMTCHLPHSSPNEDLLMYTGYRACFNCHSAEAGASLSSPDIYARMTANDDIDAHHDVMSADQAQSGSGRMACQNCHNSHGASETTPLIDPYDPAPWNGYTSISPAFSSITNNVQNSFCFECHDNSLPTAADTLPWVEAPMWSDPSGDGTATSDHDDITANWSAQRHGQGSTNNENVWSDISTLYGANPELECTACHDAHGTLGVRNLRSDMAGREGLLIVQLEDHVSGGTGFDSRFWCMGCHQDAGQTHTSGGKSWNTFPKNCSGSSKGAVCHTHSNGAGQF